MTPSCLDHLGFSPRPSMDRMWPHDRTGSCRPWKPVTYYAPSSRKDKKSNSLLIHSQNFPFFSLVLSHRSATGQPNTPSVSFTHTHTCVLCADHPSRTWAPTSSPTLSPVNAPGGSLVFCFNQSHLLHTLNISTLKLQS